MINDENPIGSQAPSAAETAAAPIGEPSSAVPVTTTPAPEPSTPQDQDESTSAASSSGEPLREAEPSPTTASADPSAAEPEGPSREEAESATISDELLFEAEMAKLEADEGGGGEVFKKLVKGDRIEATVVQVENDRVFVDLGTKSEGVVPLSELSDESIESAHGQVKVGDRIQVIVLRPESGEGNAIVSKKRADFEETWDRIVATHQQGTLLTAPVVDRVKGGLVVDIGVRGFVPGSHVGNGKLRNLDRFVGQVLPLKILEIDRDRKKVVLSNRLAEEERREQVRQEIFTRVQPGDVLEGTVRRLTDYGAFVDLGGVDGLLHISEMSWMRINHPKEVLKEGQKIKVMVLRLDSANSKISLGLRQVLPDPWNLIRENYRVGQKIQCKIGRIVQSGAFVRLPEGAEAFLPVSEMSNRRIAKPQDVINEGDEVEVTIIDLRPEERRMVLSLRGGAMPEGPSGADRGYGRGSSTGFEDEGMGRGRGPAGKKGRKRRGGGRGYDEDEYEGSLTGRVPTGGATIGERLGMLKGILRPTEEEDLETESEAEADSPEDVAEDSGGAPDSEESQA